jgi:hypothetical protein
MKTYLFYRPNSEHALAVEEYVRDFERRTGKQLPTMDVDSKEGMTLCTMHDIVRYPTILTTDNDGRELYRWDGDMLPQISEVSYYVEDQR